MTGFCEPIRCTRSLGAGTGRGRPVTEERGSRCASCGQLAVWFTGAVKTKRFAPGWLPVVVSRETRCDSCGVVGWEDRRAASDGEPGSTDG